jgi:hypothetical protein
MSRFSVIFLLLIGPSAFGQAANVYVTPTGAATGNCPTGTGSSPNLTAAQYNTAGNWGSSSGKIGPGTQVLVCGTFTGTAGQADLLFAQGSGSAGSPIVVKLDTGANITSPYWGGGSNAAVAFVNLSYITFDGGGTGSAIAGTFVQGGIIQNTANGSGLANNAYSTAVWINGSNHIIVQNLAVANICQHTSSADNTGCVTSGNLPAAVISQNSSNVTFTNNLIHDTAYGFYHNAGASDSTVTYIGNVLYRCNQCIAVGTAAGANAIDTVSVQNNEMYDMMNWDTASDTFHHNFIFIFQGSGGTITNVTLNGNYMHGDCGVNSTSYVFYDPNGGTITSTQIFNNLMVNTSSNAPGNAYFTGLGTGTCAAYNNTIDGANVQNANGFSLGFKTDHSCTIKNNLVENIGTGIAINAGTTLTASDFNLFYNLHGGTGFSQMQNGVTGYATVAAWTTGTGFDTGTQTGNPLLSAGYKPTAGSSAITNGVNLTSLGIPALDLDRAGVSRSASVAWDIGAYTYSTGGPTMTAPAAAIFARVPRPKERRF